MDVTVTDTKTPDGMAAEAYIARLGARGIEYVFANAGTDFAPIVEALSRAKDAFHDGPPRERRHGHGARLLPHRR
jgi:thiamine pyrophosphate-dependent acetolactate synthase large subunit-like protein